MPRPQTAVVANYEVGPALPGALNFDTVNIDPIGGAGANTVSGELKFRTTSHGGAAVSLRVENPGAVDGVVMIEASYDNVNWIPISDFNHQLIVGPLAPTQTEPQGAGSGSALVGTALNLANLKIVAQGHVLAAFNLRPDKDKYFRVNAATVRLLIQIRPDSVLELMRV